MNEHAGINIAELRHALRGFLDTFRSRTLWLIAAFLFCYYFSPGFGTPLYFHMTDQPAFFAGHHRHVVLGQRRRMDCGRPALPLLLRGMTTRALLNLSILAGTLATLAFLGMVDETSAIAVYFLNGVAGMIANIATLTLAADHCPKRSEGFAFAALMSVINLATPLADTIGAFLYQHRVPPGAGAADRGVGGVHRVHLRACAAARQVRDSTTEDLTAGEK